MKKLLAILAGIMFLAGGSLMADNICFSYGTNFFSPSDSALLTTNGTTSSLEWKMGDGMTLAVVNEQTVLDDGVNNDGMLTVRGIRITQSVINRVRIGLGLGAGMVNPGTIVGLAVENESVVDVMGEVTMFESSSDTVSGSLVATVGARYMRTPNSALIDDLNGSNLGLAVKLGF